MIVLVVEFNRNAVCFGLELNNLDDFLNYSVHDRSLLVNREGAVLEEGAVQQVLCVLGQHLCGPLDAESFLELVRICAFLKQKFGVQNDALKRRHHLVAHAGGEAIKELVLLLDAEDLVSFG